MTADAGGQVAAAGGGTLLGRPETAPIASRDAALRDRARRVIPGGMYGHQSAATWPAPFPQFLERGRGSRIWDVDGREYVDFVCSFGPIVLGHAHPAVEAAVERQRALADCQNGPSPRMVELAERLVDLVPHADWAMFAKNGTDATTLALSIARAATGRRKVLVARGAYHGSAPWCTPRPAGTTAEDRAHLIPFVYNDLASVEAAADQAGGDLAGVLVSAFRHDARFDQEECDPAFARGDPGPAAIAAARCSPSTMCARASGSISAGAGSPSASGPTFPRTARPSRTAIRSRRCSGAIPCGTPRSRCSSPAPSGSPRCRWRPRSRRSRRSREERGLERMLRAGTRLREGLARQARAHGLRITQSGPVQLPFMTFAADVAAGTFDRANVFTGESARLGVWLHPWHNWFLSAAHTDADVDFALDRTDAAFGAVRARFGPDGSPA